MADGVNSTCLLSSIFTQSAKLSVGDTAGKMPPQTRLEAPRPHTLQSSQPLNPRVMVLGGGGPLGGDQIMGWGGLGVSALIRETQSAPHQDHVTAQ